MSLSLDDELRYTSVCCLRRAYRVAFHSAKRSVPPTLFATVFRPANRVRTISPARLRSPTTGARVTTHIKDRVDALDRRHALLSEQIETLDRRRALVSEQIETLERKQAEFQDAVVRTPAELRAIESDVLNLRDNNEFKPREEGLAAI